MELAIIQVYYDTITRITLIRMIWSQPLHVISLNLLKTYTATIKSSIRETKEKECDKIINNEFNFLPLYTKHMKIELLMKL